MLCSISPKCPKSLRNLQLHKKFAAIEDLIFFFFFLGIGEGEEFKAWTSTKVKQETSTDAVGREVG